MKMINFDRQKLKELKNLYNKAVKGNKESFTYNGDEYLTSYAKYVIEYLETRFNETKKTNLN